MALLRVRSIDLIPEQLEIMRRNLFYRDFSTI